MPKPERFVQLEHAYEVRRTEFQLGTWVDYAFPYAKPVKARVMTSNGRRKVTKRMGTPVDGNLNEWRVLLQQGPWVTIAGVIGIYTLQGEPSASPANGIVMFKANPNGVNSGTYPVGWYYQHHE